MSEVRTLEQIEQEIAETKAALMDVHGTETEVYARIVGYYRAVKHWNNGKRDEYNLRKMFTLEDSHLQEKAAETSSVSKENKPLDIINKNVINDEHPVLNTGIATYELYTRKTCPNCPPVKEFMNHIEISGRNIDVDSEAGLAEAAKNGVFASPTVIFYNLAGVETARCHNVEELEAVFQNIAVLA